MNADNGAAEDSPDAGSDPSADDAETACQDGLDNDVDGLRDCADPDCASAPSCASGVEDCTNTFDDDGDGLRDCQDQDCDGVGICEFGAEVSCDDGGDNDLDLMIDCADPDCALAENCAPELVCDDGVDDDEDGMVDCLDADCDGVGTCEHSREVSCGDGQDNDADGMTDCGDPDCGASIACATLCPTNSTQLVLAGGNMPLTIPDPGATLSTVNGNGGGIVTQVGLAVNITHSWVGDLTLSLESPLGTMVTVSNRNGSLDDNYTGTVFVDSATTAIGAGTAPFTGAFKPDEPLSVLLGEPVDGDWTFHIADEASVGTGTVDGWELLLCVCQNCEVGAACLDGNDNDGDSMADCADPDCAGVAQCIPEAVCDDGGDSDLDGLVDCLDDDCDGTGICEFATETTCDDGEDNDGDGRADCADTDCSALTACVPESDCHDGADNDGDSMVDCLDPGCYSDPTCQPAGETLCGDGVDNDSDGVMDCAEPGCALACASPACGAGEALYGGSAAGLPRGIVDNTTTAVAIPLTGTGTVTRTIVRMSATHTYTGDLDISLVSPTGTSIDLSSDNGGGADNYTSTVFSDAATTLITAGTAPFTGTFKPEVALAGVNGQNVAGDWTLSVADDAGGDTGSLTAYDLAICVSP